MDYMKIMECAEHQFPQIFMYVMFLRGGVFCFGHFELKHLNCKKMSWEEKF